MGAHRTYMIDLSENDFEPNIYMERCIGFYKGDELLESLAFHLPLRSSFISAWER